MMSSGSGSRLDAAFGYVHRRGEVVSTQGELEDRRLERPELLNILGRGGGQAGPPAGLVGGVLHEGAVVVVEILRRTKGSGGVGLEREDVCNGSSEGRHAGIVGLVERGAFRRAGRAERSKRRSIVGGVGARSGIGGATSSDGCDRQRQ
jgi:hypothetical protein